MEKTKDETQDLEMQLRLAWCVILGSVSWYRQGFGVHRLQWKANILNLIRQVQSKPILLGRSQIHWSLWDEILKWLVLGFFFFF